MSFCVSKHGRCRPKKEISPPTRLIDVGFSSSGKARLCRTKSEGRDLKYATLSHCWGADSSKISKLRICNITTMLSEIDESELSTSFQDAIKITRALGIRYLWIDALCII